MNIIKDNPYRILGVTANARMKEIQKNISKSNAYLSIGKTISFGFDDELFGKVLRDESSITKATNELQLDENRIENALFWIVEVNEIDSVANENIKKGKIDKALEIWEKKVSKSSINEENFSAYNNLATLLIAKEKYAEAIRLKSNLLESAYIQNFGRVVCDDNYKVNTSSLTDSFIKRMITSLSETGIKESKIINLFTDSSESIKDAVTNKFVQTPRSNLDKSIEEAKTLLKKGMSESFTNRRGGDIGRDLMNKTKNDINQLKIILGVNHFNYKLYSDKLAIQLEQCGVAYFNANGDDYDYLDVYKYALKIAAGDNTKSKLKEAIKHSNQIEEQNKCWFCGVNKVEDGCEERFQMHKWETPKYEFGGFGSLPLLNPLNQNRKYSYFQDGGLPLARCRSCFDNHREFGVEKLFKWIKGESRPAIKKDDYQTKRRHPAVLQKISEGYEPGLPE